MPRAKLLIDACLINVPASVDSFLPQPDALEKQTCVTWIYVDSHASGGDDKNFAGGKNCVAVLSKLYRCQRGSKVFHASL